MLAIEYGFREIKFSPWKGFHQVRLQGKSFIPYTVQWDTYVSTWNIFSLQERLSRQK
jgi:hypothetical protein